MKIFKRKNTRHRRQHSMLRSSNSRRHRGGLLALGIIFAIVLSGFMAWSFVSLRRVAGAQYLITNVAKQTEIVCDEHIPAEVILENLGICTGANIAEIDFQKKREELLKRIPGLLSLSITLQVPDRIHIEARERTPVARLEIKGRKKSSGSVVDDNGRVFTRSAGTRMLPVIREKYPTKPGHDVKEKALAAIDVIRLCNNDDFSDMRVLEIDAANRDFLSVVFSSYDRAKIAWRNMGKATSDLEELSTIMHNLQSAIRSKIDSRVQIWVAMDPKYIYADTKEAIQ